MHPPPSPTPTFPPGFVWGASSSPACVEGETVSDWARISAPDGSVPDDGPRHWRRYRYDFRAMADLGIRAYRFGMDWARLQREPYGELNRNDTYRYLEMLAELRSLGIEPWLTLFRDALPRWAAASGGWLNPETPHWFADFARRIAAATDGEARHWVTVHEPTLYAMSCHAWDAYPGGSWGRLDHVRRALRNLREGHALAARALRKRLPDANVGIALPGGCFAPRRAWRPDDHFAACAADWILNRYSLKGFLKAKDAACDFLMIGVGNELRVTARDALSLSSAVSAALHKRMRHEPDAVSAERRRSCLEKWLRRTGLPVYLVGKSNASPGNASSAEFLSAYAGGADAEGAGCRAAGFFREPLLDGFDPHKGLSAGGGLLKVDFHSPDRRREIRPAARRYSDLIKGCKATEGTRP